MLLPNPLLVDTATPPIPEAQAWLRRYDGAAGPAIDLSQAVPGYPPHPEMLERLAAAAGSPAAARYGEILGDGALRTAYAAETASLYGGEIAPERVIVTAGCNQAFFVAMLAIARAGDAVLLPTPWYFNHEMALAMLGVEARALPCPTERGFTPDPDAAAALIDGRVRAVVLVTPNNPTGAIYPPEVIAAFSELCRSRGIFLVLDETYRDFLPAGAGRPHPLLEGAADHVVQLYSFSKAYCIPGHRIGAMIAPGALVPQIAKVMDTVQICAPRVGQLALPWAIGALAAWREANRREIEARAAAFRAAIATLPGWRIDAIGAYFAYLRHPGGGEAAAAVAERLAVERGVLCLPGSYFGRGQQTHLRVAFANAGVEQLTALARRLQAFA